MSQLATNNASGVGQEADPPKKNRVFPIILTVLVLAGGSFGIIKYIHAQHHEETDDAQVEANISPVIPRISGYVTEVRVRDNQRVKKGDTLILLDNKQVLIQLAQAKAALEATRNNLSFAQATTAASRSNIGTFEANMVTIDAQIEASKVTLRRATQDFERYANLIKDHSITQQQYDQAEAAKESAEKQLQVLSEQRNAVSKQVGAASVQAMATDRQSGVVKATIQQRQADVDNALLNLSYSVVIAPQDGNVSRVSIQVGQYLQGGQTMFSVVANDAPWVIANFKETQMHKLRSGQKVIVRVDAVPNHDFEGRVVSMSPATGARFSLLPPDNASGNFVKTVQRLPVKIELTKSDNFVKSLRAGMNVTIDVHLD
jgi:membrane fusion protein, multidrug efflux system